MIEIIAVVALSLICIAQTVERYFYQKDMTNKLNDAVKAIMSRNINEYLTATAKPKYSKNIPVEQEEVDFNADNPEEFDRAIKNIVK